MSVWLNCAFSGVFIYTEDFCWVLLILIKWFTISIWKFSDRQALAATTFPRKIANASLVTPVLSIYDVEDIGLSVFNKEILQFILLNSLANEHKFCLTFSTNWRLTQLDAKIYTLRTPLLLVAIFCLPYAHTYSFIKIPCFGERISRQPFKLPSFFWKRRKGI